MRSDTLFSAVRFHLQTADARGPGLAHRASEPVLVRELRRQIGDALGRGRRCSHGYPAAIDAVAITWGPESTLSDTNWIELRVHLST